MEPLVFTEYGITYPYPKTEGLYVIRYNNDGGTFFAIAKWCSKEKKFFDESDPRRFFSRVTGYKLLKNTKVIEKAPSDIVSTCNNYLHRLTDDVK